MKGGLFILRDPSGVTLRMTTFSIVILNGACPSCLPCLPAGRANAQNDTLWRFSLRKSPQRVNPTIHFLILSGI